MTRSLPQLLDAVRSLSAAFRTLYWGDCPQCKRPTPWQTNALRGEYRCTQCGHSPLDA